VVHASSRVFRTSHPTWAATLSSSRTARSTSVPWLDLRQRQLVTISALTALGGVEPQLEVHINAGLNAGLNPREVVEAILHCIPYIGFPRVLNAIFVAKRVFQERGVSPLAADS
jgi:alkylhydroperoxidase/carboxymuconolactone decarboxylase family protein YurZ